jgi:type II secretory pathway component GspD/PulD (secretin)
MGYKKGRNLICKFFLLFLTSYSLLLTYTPTAKATDEALAAPAVEPPSANLTLELQGVSIFDVFKILSKKSGINIVAGKNVQGQVSIFLQDVPVREALKTILQSQGLASIEEGGIVKVMTEEEYLAKYGHPYGDQRVSQSFHIKFATVEALAPKLSELRSPHGKIISEPRTNTLLITDLPQILAKMETLIQESDQPQETKVFQLRYAQAETLEPKLKALLEGSSGKLDIDKRSNQIIVVDISSRIQQVKDVLKAFDVQVPQVLIEARIVEVQLNDKFRQGINWEAIANEIGEQSLRTAIPLAVAPPVGAAALTTLTLGESGDDVHLVLSLLERVGKTNLLSSPRITVMNNEEAKLAVATRQPFVSQTVVQTVNSTNTADNVQFIDVGVTLKVQPRISHDDFVEMKIRPEISSSNQSIELEGVAQGSNTTFTRTRIPVVTTQELETTVQVKSGTTLIIGGLIQDRQEKSSNKIPVIGSLPIIGRAFQSKSHDFEKTELVLFLTPTLVHASDSHNEQAERFWDRQGEVLPFDEFGKVPYRNTYTEPLRYAKTGEVPYWQSAKNKKSNSLQKKT